MLQNDNLSIHQTGHCLFEFELPNYKMIYLCALFGYFEGCHNMLNYPWATKFSQLASRNDSTVVFDISNSHPAISEIFSSYDTKSIFHHKWWYKKHLT